MKKSKKKEVVKRESAYEHFNINGPEYDIYSHLIGLLSRKYLPEYYTASEHYLSIDDDEEREHFLIEEAVALETGLFLRDIDVYKQLLQDFYTEENYCDFVTTIRPKNPARLRMYLIAFMRLGKKIGTLTEVEVPISDTLISTKGRLL